MSIFHWKYTPHLLWLAILIAVFFLLIYVIGDGSGAVSYAMGITANIFDPFIWVLAALPAIWIRRPIYVALSLVLLAVLVAAFKVQMSGSTGFNWVTGSMAGNIFGFVTVGYIINAIAITFRKKAVPANASDA